MSIEAMKQALEALEYCKETYRRSRCMEDVFNEAKVDQDITALRAAVDAELEQAMVEVWQTAPRQWVGLTDEDWKQLWDEFDSLDIENDFQDHMVGKYGEGHYTDTDMYWQFQQQMIKQMVNAKLEEKNSG
jgi:hypothetical protein